MHRRARKYTHSHRRVLLHVQASISKRGGGSARNPQAIVAVNEHDDLHSREECDQAALDKQEGKLQVVDSVGPRYCKVKKRIQYLQQAYEVFKDKEHGVPR